MPVMVCRDAEKLQGHVDPAPLSFKIKPKVPTRRDRVVLLPIAYARHSNVEEVGQLSSASEGNHEIRDGLDRSW